ncbi:hypothetical protein AKG60_24830 [Vibrio parahaemolyticus]|uniref:DNA replication terminus site-binding protein n=2 Tax=Vibrio parahaemolyticus TaxID=670 RepID=A0AAX0M8A4_VIBPH|nr:hypothetical protein [Vibrio parahaemolyticus]EJG0765841.1 hypothetical protein [Vibrio parahaemolyticus O5:K30]MCS0330468.1 hypothetical protein [Vibrio diabolicus]HAT8518476.1 hypothetical protein [Vibrio vulnificus]EGR2221100.1 hypothetical protein [Vibrio parahaemolyticus]
MSFSELSIRFKKCFNDILFLSDLVIRSVDEESVILPEFENHNSGIGFLTSALNDYWHSGEGDARFTSCHVGIVLANRQTIQYLNLLNKKKVEFHQLYNSLNEISKLEMDNFLVTLCKSGAIHARLSRLGLSRIHIKQVYRHIYSVDGNVKSVAYSHYKRGKSIVKYDKEKAEADLIALNKSQPPHIKIQLEKLYQHPSSIPLVQVRTNAPTIKANIFFEDVTAPLTIKTKMPIFVRSTGDFKVSFAPSMKNRNVSTRSDSTIEPEPFLPSISVYRKIKP